MYQNLESFHPDDRLYFLAGSGVGGGGGGVGCLSFLVSSIISQCSKKRRSGLSKLSRKFSSSCRDIQIYPPCMCSKNTSPVPFLKASLIVG